jgi:hypothetical protein
VFSTRESDMADKLEIREALERYARGLDRRDLEMALSAFHDISHVEHGHFRGSGHDWVRFVLSSPPIDRIGIGSADPALDVVESQQHHVTNQLIELHGDMAYSEAYFLQYTLTNRGGQRLLSSVGGRYCEQYERRGGQWRIVERQALRDWDSVTPIITRFPKWEDSPQGARDRTDATYWHGEAGIPPGPPTSRAADVAPAP